MPARATSYFSTIALALLLTACASAPAPVAPQNLLAETDDLGMVADTAMQQAAYLGPDDVLVVFDIDNTLLAMEQGLGSDQWYRWQKQLAGQNPCSSQLVNDLLRVQGALYYASAMRPTQPDAAQQVARVQQAGLKVIALTSRGPDFSLQTFRELRRNGYSFWSSALPPAHGYPEPFIPAGGQREALYQDGVFLTAGQDKGVMLKALLGPHEDAWPGVVVVVDDSLENLQDVMAAFEHSGTRIHAWRYSSEDGNVVNLDKAEASKQWDAVRPALMTLQAVFGPDNFDLPEQTVPEGCGAGAN
jgi:hypothetical protein